MPDFPADSYGFRRLDGFDKRLFKVKGPSEGTQAIATVRTHSWQNPQMGPFFGGIHVITETATHYIYYLL